MKLATKVVAGVPYIKNFRQRLLTKDKGLKRSYLQYTIP